MAGIAYKEQVLSYGTEETLLFNYTESFPNLGDLDWAQSFYLQHSILICKVYSSNLLLDQLFLCASGANSDQVSSIEQNKKVRIALPDPIIPSLCLTCDDRFFTIFVATCKEKVFKFTFEQGFGFSNVKYLREMGGFSLPGLTPRCFSLLRISENDADVCFGLETGSVFFVTLPPASNSEYVLPIGKGIELGPRTSIIRTLASFVKKRQHNEGIISIANIKNNRIVALNSSGVLRLYDSSTPAFLNELDLETGELFDCRCSWFADIGCSYLAVGYKELNQWWVYFIKVHNNNFEVASKFTEKGNLIDLNLNSQGIWSVWKPKSTKPCKIIVKPHIGDFSSVFSFSDQMLFLDIQDDSYTNIYENPEEIIQRICLPGRFEKKALKAALQEVLGIELSIECYPSANEMKDLSCDQLQRVLQTLKQMQLNETEIIAICCSQEIGSFPSFVIRGSEQIGLLAEVKNRIEAISLYIKKAAIENFSLEDSASAERINRFKFLCKGQGIEKALLIIRLWRIKAQNALKDKKVSFKEFLNLFAMQNIPNHLFQLLKRALPSDLDYLAHLEIQEIMNMCSKTTEKDMKFSFVYWPGFMLSLLGNCVQSTLEAIFEHSIDLALLLIIASSSLKTFLMQPISKECLQSAISLSTFLFATNASCSVPVEQIFTHSSLFKQVCMHFEGFSFPITICPIYIMHKADVLLGDKSSFCPSELSVWLSNAAQLSLQELLVYPNDSNFVTSPVIKLLSNYGEAKILQRYIKDRDEVNTAYLYLEGKALIAQENYDLGQNCLVKSGAILISGDLTETYRNFLKGPWEIDTASQNVNILSLYNSSIIKSTKAPKKVILSEFLISSLYADFTEEKICKTVEQLNLHRFYGEALTILQSHTNKRMIKSCISKIIETVLSYGEFSLFLKIPLSHLNKEMALSFLQSKSLNEHFDLLMLISSERYYEKASTVFLNEYGPEERQRHKNSQINWTHALYSFSSINQYYSSAAECMYRFACEIKSFADDLRLNGQNCELEVEFLIGVYRDHLILTNLAARNINENYEECWFLVSNGNYRSKRKSPEHMSGDDNKITRKLVTLKELEEEYFRI